MCILMYIYIYTRVYIYIMYIYIYMHACTHPYIYTGIHAHTSIHTYMHTTVSMHRCMHAYSPMYVHVHSTANICGEQRGLKACQLHIATGANGKMVHWWMFCLYLPVQHGDFTSWTASHVFGYLLQHTYMFIYIYIHNYIYILYNYI